MDEMERKLSYLESKLNDVAYQQQQNEYEDVSTQLSILEELSRFYNSTSSLERVNRLRLKLQEKPCYSMYNPKARTTRIDRFSEKIDNIVNTNKFLNQQVMGQAETVDKIGLGVGTTEENMFLAYAEIEKYRMYITRKNRHIRIVVILVVVMIIIMCIKLVS